jgi:hypothetical protein
MRPRFFLPTFFFSALCLVGCAGLAIPGQGQATPLPSNELTYDGAITLSIKNGQTLPGTNLGYQGKSADGRALLVIDGQQAAKSTLDSVNYSGSLAPGTQLNLSTRVATFDQNGITLIGTVHIVVQDPQPQPGNPASDSITGYGVQVQYTVNKNATIPGTTVQYLGSSTQGAQFSGLGQFPYRQQFDSVVWGGHLRDKVAIQLDLRLLNYSDTSATLVGTAQISFEK